MWLFILGSVMIASVAGVLFVLSRMEKLTFIERLSHGRANRKKLISFGILLMLCLIIYFLSGAMNLMIILIHLLIVWILAELAATVVLKLCFGSRKSESRDESASDTATKQRCHNHEDYVALFSVVFTCVYLAIGMYLNYSVVETDYTLSTDKSVGDVRIVQFADSHIGTSLSGERLARYVDRMNTLEPDVVVITGDFIDESTNRKEMYAACEALGRLKTRYGVYYAYGNHDRGYFRGDKRGYDGNDFAKALEDNNVEILEDEAKLIDDRFYIVGRLDGARLSAESIVEGLDKSRYMVMLDHEPSDYAAEAAVGADLVLSGHTHGGQLLPVIHAGEWMGANDATYGYERIGDTDFIVSSGISSWQIKFKTGCRSEFVVVDVHGTEK